MSEDARLDSLRRAVEEGNHDPKTTSRARRLVDRLRRIGHDLDRLDEVERGLQADEQDTRDELFDILRIGRKESHVPEVEEPSNGLTIWFLGTFRLAYHGREITMCGGDRTASVLRFLAAQDATGVHKEQLTARFWPDAEERTARRNLHQTIYTVRRWLAGHGAEDEIRFTNDRYALGGPDCWRDTDRLVCGMERLRRARREGDQAGLVDAGHRIDDLYRGEFLVDHPYDEWAEPERQRFRALHREAVAGLVDHYAIVGEPHEVVRLTERLLALDPTDDDACRNLIRAHTVLGQTQLARLAFESHRRALADELGVSPSEETAMLVALMGNNERPMRDY